MKEPEVPASVHSERLQLRHELIGVGQAKIICLAAAEANAIGVLHFPAGQTLQAWKVAKELGQCPVWQESDFFQVEILQCGKEIAQAGWRGTPQHYVAERDLLEAAEVESLLRDLPPVGDPIKDEVLDCWGNSTRCSQEYLSGIYYIPSIENNSQGEMVPADWDPGSAHQRACFECCPIIPKQLNNRIDQLGW
jgi:hypothetical protein